MRRLGKKEKIDLAKLIEKVSKKEPDKKEEVKKEDEKEEIIILQFMPNLNVSSNENTLDTTLKEDLKKQTLETTTSSAVKKEDEKETDKKIYQISYNSQNDFYKERKNTSLEVRPLAHLTTFEKIEQRTQTTVLGRVQMIDKREIFGQDLNSRDNSENYKLSEIRDPLNQNPFNPEREIKEKKYQI